MNNSKESEFFKYSTEFYNFFKDLNSELNDTYGVCFVSPVLINSFDSMIIKHITDENNLNVFKENFNNFADYERFCEKDIQYYHKLFLDNISLFSLPQYAESILLSNLNTIFDPENDYLEEDHIDTCCEYIKKIIKAGLTETKLIPDDERWLKN